MSADPDSHWTDEPEAFQPPALGLLFFILLGPVAGTWLVAWLVSGTLGGWVYWIAGASTLGWVWLVLSAVWDGIRRRAG